ncbi:MAG: cation diffusion facilitator family transporter [Chitinophagales bacterium]|jgi:cation diffusion facilitator family transporter|nr:cation diffusion facilitator family transporter [Chitinophagales bacterium]
MNIIQLSYFSILSSFFLAILKIIIGIKGNSFALIADAVESSLDVVTSVFVMIGLKISMKPADQNHPYGHGKAEALSSFLVSTVLIISATLLIAQGIRNCINPHALPKFYTLYFLGFIIIVKEMGFQFIRKKNTQFRSLAMDSEAFHHRADAITSLFGMIGIGLSLYFKCYFIDDIAAIIASLVIFYNAYQLLKPALSQVMDEFVYEDIRDIVINTAMEIPEVLGTEKCFVRKMGGYYHIDLHIEVDAQMNVKDSHEIAHQVKDLVKSQNSDIADIHIHVEPYSLE